MINMPAPELTLDQIDALFKETCTKGASGTPKEAGRLFAGEIIRELNRLWKAKLDNQLQHLQSLASSDTWDERTEEESEFFDPDTVFDGDCDVAYGAGRLDGHKMCARDILKEMGITW